jgi:hypothetical protein
MALGFAVFKGTTALDHNGSFRAPQRTHPSATRAGLLLAQLARLLLGCRLQRARQQTTHGRQAHVFHLSQINVQARTLLPPVLADNDFSPTLRQFRDARKIFRRRFPYRHDASLQRDASISPDEILP